MKICFLTHDYPPVDGGISRYAKELTEGLASLGHKIDVITIKNKDFPEIEAKKLLTVYRTLPISFINPFNLFLAVSKLKKHIKKTNPKVMLAFDCATTGLVGVLAHGRTKLLVFSHGGEALMMKRSNISFIVRFILNSADKILTNSKSSKSILNSILGYVDNKTTIKCKKNIEVVYPGVDINHFRYDRVGASKLKKKLNLANKKIILTVGRLDKRKGVDDVIVSLPLLLREIPHLVYIIAGKGPMEPQLKTMVKDKSLDKNVIFVGYVPDEELPAYYSLCDVFIAPSKETNDGSIEGFGMVLIEANACKRAVIGSSSGGIPEAIRDGETGIIFQSGNNNELYSALLKLLTQPKLAKKLGENGEKIAKTEFSWPIITKRFNKLIQTNCLI